MKQDEIIEMARQAGFLTNEIKSYVISPYTFEDQDLYQELETFAKLVASAASAKEREALLDVVYGYARSLSWNEDFQADIRARGEA